MHDISIDKARKKTIIEVPKHTAEAILETYGPECIKQFVPPLFDEFTIFIKSMDVTKEACKIALEDEIKGFAFYDEKTKQTEIDKFYRYLKKQNALDGECKGIYCKYQTATSWTLIYFDNRTHTKLCNIQIDYFYDEDCEGTEYSPCVYNTNTCFYQFKNNEKPPREMESQVQNVVLTFLSICYYMQNHSKLVEYDRIEVSPMKKSEEPSKVNKQHNKGYYQKIILKSKRKKYVINTEEKQKKKRYKKLTACWYVRGYYQHFGKEKVLKYIPPRINRRDKYKFDKPKNKKYEIKD